MRGRKSVRERNSEGKKSVRERKQKEEQRELKVEEERGIYMKKGIEKEKEEYNTVRERVRGIK